MTLHSIGGLCRGATAQTRVNQARYEVSLVPEGRLVKRLLFFLSQDSDKRSAALRAPDRVRFVNQRAGEVGWRNDNGRPTEDCTTGAASRTEEEYVVEQPDAPQHPSLAHRGFPFSGAHAGVDSDTVETAESPSSLYQDGAYSRAEAALNSLHNVSVVDREGVQYP